jgi:hypothetical protein
MKQPDTPLINGITYSWSIIVVNVMDVLVKGITAIEYGDDQNIENHYGAGRMPIGRGFGNIEPTAKVTIDAEEVEAITSRIPGRRLQDAGEFDVTVSYVPESGIGMVTHKIKNCRFKNNNRNIKQNDTRITVELDLIPSHIVW